MGIKFENLQYGWLWFALQFSPTCLGAARTNNSMKLKCQPVDAMVKTQ